MINDFKLIRDLKPGSVFLVEDKQGRKFVFKETAAAQRMIKFAETVKLAGGDLADLVPSFYGQGNFFWEEYLDWELAGDTVKTYGITKEAFAKINPEKLGRAIGQLQKLSPPCHPEFSSGSDPALGGMTKEMLKQVQHDKDDRNFLDLEIRTADFYLKNIDEFEPALTEEFGNDFSLRVEQFLSSRKELVDSSSHFLANGDLHPQNIMINLTPPSPTRRGSWTEIPSLGKRGEGDFKLIDWDLLHLNNPGWDLCDLYVWGWRDSSWGERLIDVYKKVIVTPEIEFDEIFAFDVVYLSSQLIKHAKLISAPQEFLEAQKKILIKFMAS